MYPTEQDKIAKLMMDEPFDHFGFAKVYQMYLQHISVLCSNSPDVSYLDAEVDDKFWAM